MLITFVVDMNELMCLSRDPGELLVTELLEE